MAKPLYKLREGRIISGVCAGLAEYFNIDVNIVRICAKPGKILFFHIQTAEGNLAAGDLSVINPQESDREFLFHPTKSSFFGKTIRR